jgi:hypothetical protein
VKTPRLTEPCVPVQHVRPYITCCDLSIWAFRLDWTGSTDSLCCATTCCNYATGILQTAIQGQPCFAAKDLLDGGTVVSRGDLRKRDGGMPFQAVACIEILRERCRFVLVVTQLSKLCSGSNRENLGCFWKRSDFDSSALFIDAVTMSICVVLVGKKPALRLLQHTASVMLSPQIRSCEVHKWCSDPNVRLACLGCLLNHALPSRGQPVQSESHAAQLCPLFYAALGRCIARVLTPLQLRCSSFLTPTISLIRNFSPPNLRLHIRCSCLPSLSVAGSA